MIEINLLPGAVKSKGRGSGINFKSYASAVGAKIRDPYMLSAVASVLVAAAAIGGMHLTQSSSETALTGRVESAQRDSARFAIVLKERRKAEAKRDSVMTQLNIIRSIDNDRFVWPHILDEVSRALPPYTWLKSVVQTSAMATPAAAVKADTGKAKDTEKELPAEPDVLRFRVIGNTVDIQALTRFMKLLETSPFIKNVQLAKSESVLMDGKQVTEFHLDAEYERPDKSVLTTAPVSLSVR
jgi:Tfp pilus assembly protein PilN